MFGLISFADDFAFGSLLLWLILVFWGGFGVQLLRQ